MVTSAAGSAFPESPAPSWPRVAGLVAALAACGVAQWYIRHRLEWGPASVALVLASFAVAILLGRPAARRDVAASAPVRQLPGWTGWLSLLISVAGFALFAYNVDRLAVGWTRHFDVAAPLVVLGITVWSIGLALGDPGRRWGAPATPIVGWEVALVVAIVAMGIFMRFYRYDYYPPTDGVCAVEEPQAGQTTHLIVDQQYRPWEFFGDRWMPVPFFKAMGPNLTALRLPFTIISALTVLALYCLLRQLVARPAALFGTALSAMCSWNLVYARLAHNIFATTFFVIIIFAMCVHAHRRGGLAWYPWIGVLTGYTLYTYAGYRGTGLFVALFLGLSLLIHAYAWYRSGDVTARAAAFRVVRLQVIGLVLAATACAGPVLVLVGMLRSNPAYYFEAANRSLINKDYYTADTSSFIHQRVERLRQTAMMFNHVGDGSETFNLPAAPMLDPISGLLLPIGLAYCLVWGRYRWQGYFAVVFLVLLVMGTTFVQNFDIRRLQGIIPLIFVLAAFVADRAGQVATARLGERARPAVGLALFAIAAVTLALNYDFFFRRMINDHRVRSAFQNRYTLATGYLNSLSPDIYLLLVSDAVNFFMANDFSWMQRHDVPGGVTTDLLPLLKGEPGPWTGKQLRVLIQEPLERQDLIRLVQAAYPAAQCHDVIHPDADPHQYMSACELQPGAAPHGFHDGVRARYFLDDQPQPFLERLDPAIAYGFVPVQCQIPFADGKPPCRVEWEGPWNVAQAGTYRLMLEARRGTATATIDDAPLLPAMNLSAGPHRVRVATRYNSVEELGTRLTRLNTTTQKWELVQFATFDGDAAAP